MAVLLNETSNLRLRLELSRRLSEGVESPASLEFSAGVERYKRIASAERGEHRFVPMVTFAGKKLLDMDLITFFEGLDALLRGAEGAQPLAALEPSVEPSLGLRILRGDAHRFFVEVGIDLVALLEPVGGAASDAGTDLSLFRFPASVHGVASFHAQLLEEFARFPTDPRRVSAGPRE
jgi:hypothetical protein